MTKEPVKTTTIPMSIEISNNSNATQDSVATTTTPMSIENDKTWYDANEEYNSWHDATETMDNYQEWTDPPTFSEIQIQPILLTNISNRIAMKANNREVV